MTTGATTPYGAISRPCEVRRSHDPRRPRRLRSVAGWIAALAALAALVGGLGLLAVAALPSAECERYGSCALAALMTYGTPE